MIIQGFRPFAPIPGNRSSGAAGGIGQHAAGVGVYAWFDDSLYAEFSIYGAAIRGGI
jgi:hypothetical protein